MTAQIPLSKIVIPPEIAAKMTPAVKAFFLAICVQFEARIAELEKQIKELSAKIPKGTPKNSSLPSSTLHPHNDRDKPEKKKPKSKLKPGGQKGNKDIPESWCRRSNAPRSLIIISKEFPRANAGRVWLPLLDC